SAARVKRSVPERSGARRAEFQIGADPPEARLHPEIGVADEIRWKRDATRTWTAGASVPCRGTMRERAARVRRAVALLVAGHVGVRIRIPCFEPRCDAGVRAPDVEVEDE